MNIWQRLAKNPPFFILAPMDDVTDTVFRQVVASTAPADLMMTEFANADGYCSPGKEAIMNRLKFSEAEKPLIAQIWGINPDSYLELSRDLVAMGFDGVDINMGCPVRDMIKKGACSAMINDHVLAREVIIATQEGVRGKIPVSVKTRIGFESIQTEQWIGFLLQQNLDALTIHGRTKKEMSKVPNHWDEIGKSVQLRNELSPTTIIVGNGDVMSREQGESLAIKYGLDGIMIGRGIFQNLFIFDEYYRHRSLHEMVELLIWHIELYKKTWNKTKSYEPLKKFYKLYINGFDGASQIRAELMATGSPERALAILRRLV